MSQFVETSPRDLRFSPRERFSSGRQEVLTSVTFVERSPFTPDVSRVDKGGSTERGSPTCGPGTCLRAGPRLRERRGKVRRESRKTTVNNSSSIRD